MDDRPIFLIGFMGAGKSTVGSVLGERLGWEFLDTDRMVEEREGVAVEQIFRRRGEDAFRELESRVLAELDGRRELIVAAGGGLFLRWDNRRRMKRNGRTVWLDAPLELCTARVGAGRGRPLWTPRDPVAFRSFFDRRAAVYALAEHRVRVGDEPADEVVGRILGIFN